MIRTIAFLTLVTLFITIACFAESSDKYKNELAQFVQSDDYMNTFGNRDLSRSLKVIQADIVTSKYIGFLEQFTASLVDVIVSGAITITPERMPLLYNFVDATCKSQNMKTPTIIITKSKSFFNAFAFKLLSFNGFICIGQQIIFEMSDAALEASIAHELGHIKNNHNNKFIFLGLSLPIMYCIYKFITKPNFLDLIIEDDSIDEMNISAINSILNFKYYSEHFKFARKWLWPTSMIATNILFSRSMERQADEFAYKTLNQGDGLIESLEICIKKDDIRDEGFIDTYTMLQKHKKSLSMISYLGLTLRFWKANIRAWVFKLWGQVTHPSPEARIAAIREYQQSLETNAGIAA